MIKFKGPTDCVLNALPTSQPQNAKRVQPARGRRMASRGLLDSSWHEKLPNYRLAKGKGMECLASAVPSLRSPLTPRITRWRHQTAQRTENVSICCLEHFFIKQIFTCSFCFFRRRFWARWMFPLGQIRPRAFLRGNLSPLCERCPPTRSEISRDILQRETSDPTSLFT